MYPTEVHQLTRQHQAELQRAAAEHRLAMRAERSETDRWDVVDAVRRATRSFRAALLGTGGAPGASAA